MSIHSRAYIWKAILSSYHVETSNIECASRDPTIIIFHRCSSSAWSCQVSLVLEILVSLNHPDWRHAWLNVISMFILFRVVHYRSCFWLSYDHIWHRVRTRSLPRDSSELTCSGVIFIFILLSSRGWVSWLWVTSGCFSHMEFSSHMWSVCIVTFSYCSSPVVTSMMFRITLVCTLNRVLMILYKVFTFCHCSSSASKNPFAGFITCEHHLFKLLYSNFCCGCNALSTF